VSLADAVNAPAPSVVVVRNLPSDILCLTSLYRRVAAVPCGLTREPSEISEEWVGEFLGASLERGVSLGARVGAAGAPRELAGEIHAFQGSTRALEHVWSDLTLVVDPVRQGHGIGLALLSAFMAEVRTDHPGVLRVELLVRERNHRAVRLYESLDFRQEAVLQDRLRAADGTTEAQVEMAWQRPASSRAVRRLADPFNLRAAASARREGSKWNGAGPFGGLQMARVFSSMAFQG
jgi:ribosomal protein S18 acetylase RimI-like enzyme